ncbi:MAG: zinc-dependent alcohol dehydrogenase family protein [Candidatus Hinthialibacter antarcticus]|nr:zinc-dependent alcohol dehydrogenase family protein [Candidatus Hinthialibacter antarcticus]
MKRVVVDAFGGVDQLRVVEEPTPEPGAGEVRVVLTSIGMNHADLMARRGEYRLMSGEPPFTPGLEGGGVIDAVGEGVNAGRVGERVVLGASAPRSKTDGLYGTYRSHYVVAESEVVTASDALDDIELGTLWLTYLTVWGCLVWKQNIQPGQLVAVPAASSGVGLAASQIIRAQGAVSIGMTTRQAKADRLAEMPEAMFDHIVVTKTPDGQDADWRKQLKEITDGKGVNVFFDPVASGHFLDTEIRSLAKGGVIWVYGLLGDVGPVDVSPLIVKQAAIRGWLLYEVMGDAAALQRGYTEILDGFASGAFKQCIAQTFSLDDVRAAHEAMERGDHIGKFVLAP